MTSRQQKAWSTIACTRYERCMGGRPEGSGGFGWDDYGSNPDDAFEPYRPRAGLQPLPEVEPMPASSRYEPNSGEGQTAAFQAGDKVESVRGVGGGIIDRVPAGTPGKVVSTRHGLVAEYVTVEFDNGYIEEVATSEIERERTWF